MVQKINKQVTRQNIFYLVKQIKLQKYYPCSPFSFTGYLLNKMHLQQICQQIRNSIQQNTQIPIYINIDINIIQIQLSILGYIDNLRHVDYQLIKIGKMVTKLQIMRNLLLVLIMQSICCIQLHLTQQQTCLDYIIDEPQTNTFYFHYNHNLDSVSMIIYHRNMKQIWHETGIGIEYKNSIEVNYNQTGNYTFCFRKYSPSQCDITFDIISEKHVTEYAGKEQLAKISRRISEFLMDIKRVGVNFKQVLQQHNERKDKIYQQQNGYGMLLVVKSVLMALIVAAQVYVVKKIFK